MRPKVSIIIPVYNGSNYLRAAINSALAQTYENIEILVINDGSSDNGKTRDIALSFREKIRYFEKNNGGVSSALNLGIKEMQGEYFAWLSHDDLYYPYKIQKQIEYIGKHKNNVVLHSDWDIINDKSEIISTCKHQNTDYKYFKYFNLIENKLHGCTVLVHKACFEDVGNFNEKLIYTQDNEMWFRLSNKYKILHQPEMLVQVRVHKEQGHQTNNTKNEIAHTFIKIIASLSEKELLTITNEKSVKSAYYKLASSLAWYRKNWIITDYVCSLFRSTLKGNMLKNLVEYYLLRSKCVIVHLIRAFLVEIKRKIK